MSSSKEEWRRGTLDPLLKRYPQRREHFETDSGLEIDPVYCPEDLVARDVEFESPASVNANGNRNCADCERGRIRHGCSG